VTRHVKVGLEADVAPYIAGVKAAAKATDDLGDELAELKTKGAALEVVSKQADHAGDALEDLKTDSDRAGEALRDTAVVAGLAAEAIDEVGAAARRTGRQIDKLDHEIDAAKRELQGLAAAFADADEASRADLSKGVTALERKLKELEKNRTILKALIPKPEEAVQAGAEVAQEVAKGTANGFKAKPVAIAIAGALGVAVAPVLGAAIAGAVVGGVGLGGIVGGVALAASHPEVKARGKQLGKAYFDGIKAEAEDAFAQPIMDAFGELDEWGGTALPKIGEFFDNVAPGLADFTESLIGAGDALLDSFVYASERSEAPMRALGDLIETTGNAVGSLIEDLSDHAEEGADALDDLADTISFTVGALAGLVTMLSDTYGWFGDQADVLEVGANQLTDYADGLIGVTAVQDLAEIATADLTAVTEELSDQQWAGARAARGHRDALVELSTEMKAETDPVFGLLNAQKDLAEATKKSAEATAEHGADSAEAQAALRDLAAAAIDLEGKAGALGETFNGELSAGLRATLRSAGLTNTQIDGLERQFRDAKGAAEGFAKNWKANISIPGLVKNTSDVRELRRQVEQLRSKTINVRVRVSQQGEILYGGQVGAYAEGGPIEGPGTGTSDSVPIMASAGEHMWTAAEVRAAGGHQAVEQMRAEALTGARPTTQVMPAAATQRMVVEVQQTLDLSRADATAFGQLLLSTVRTKSAIRQELKTLVNQS
jgi:hypothetical protein